MPALDQNLDVNCEFCGVQSTKLNFARQRRVVLLVHCIALNAPISLLNQEMI